MHAGAALVVYCPVGHAASATACLDPLFNHPRTLYDGTEGAIVSAVRSSVSPNKPELNDWKVSFTNRLARSANARCLSVSVNAQRLVSLELPVSSNSDRQWTVFPGLFADGGMDVMTTVGHQVQQQQVF